MTRRTKKGFELLALKLALIALFVQLEGILVSGKVCFLRRGQQIEVPLLPL